MKNIEKKEIEKKLAQIKKDVEESLATEQFKNGAKYAVKWMSDWILNMEEEERFVNLLKKRR